MSGNKVIVEVVRLGILNSCLSLWGRRGRESSRGEEWYYFNGGRWVGGIFGGRNLGIL